MPYISQESRKLLDPHIDRLHNELDNLGGLNYAITRLMLRRFYERRRYVGIVEVTGTLICVLLEFYTRHARKYENEAMERNGDLDVS